MLKQPPKDDDISRYIGLGEAEARALAIDAGWEPKVYVRDGRPTIRTAEAPPLNRLNFSIEEGEVLDTWLDD